MQEILVKQGFKVRQTRLIVGRINGIVRILTSGNQAAQLGSFQYYRLAKPERVEDEIHLIRPASPTGEALHGLSQDRTVRSRQDERCRFQAPGVGKELNRLVPVFHIADFINDDHLPSALPLQL